MTTPEIKLGQTLRDRSSGFTGIAIAQCVMMTGNIQYGLQPKGDADKLSEAQYFDHHLLEVIDSGISEGLPPIDQTVKAGIGDVVKDTLTELTGAVIEMITWCNGCVYLNVQPRGKKGDEFPKATLLPHMRLDIIEKIKVIPPKPTRPITRPPGGPTRSASAAGFALR